MILGLGVSSHQAWGVDVAVEGGVSVGGEISISAFNDQLAPDGKWVEVGTYGKVWQPAIVLTNENWRPYVDGGHWRSTDAGWYWESSYSWGWAAFHYGRWNYDDKYKWVWQPDTTWGPAWVSWRQSDSVYGWAPLPFGSRFEGGAFVGVSIDVRADLYNFVPAEGFLSVNLGTVVLPRGQVGTVYNQTKVINNSYTYNDNRVINNGVPVAQVAKATKQEIKPVAIADAKSPTEKSADGKIAAYRPAVKSEPKTAEKPADTKTPEKAPDAKVPEKTPAAKPPEKAPDTKAPEKAPDAKAPEKTPEAKTPEKAPANKAPERAPEGKAPEKAPESKTPEGKGPEKAPEGKSDEKMNQEGDKGR